MGVQWSTTSARSLRIPNSELVCQIKTTTTKNQLFLNLLSFSLSDSFICAELIKNMFLLNGTVSKHEPQLTASSEARMPTISQFIIAFNSKCFQEKRPETARLLYY